MLQVDLRAIDRGPVQTDAELAPEDPAFEGLDLALTEPLLVSGRLSATGDGDVYWQAHLGGRARAECRRCLSDVAVPVDVEVRVLFSSNPDTADDPGVYAIDAAARSLDLRQAVREELALAVPAFVLCREECAGLCPRCGVNLNVEPCRCGADGATP